MRFFDQVFSAGLSSAMGAGEVHAELAKGFQNHFVSVPLCFAFASFRDGTECDCGGARMYSYD